MAARSSHKAGNQADKHPGAAQVGCALVRCPGGIQPLQWLLVAAQQRAEQSRLCDVSAGVRGDGRDGRGGDLYHAVVYRR